MTCPICQNSVQNKINGSFLPKFKYCEVCSGHFLNDSKKPIYLKEYFREKESPTLVAKLAKPMLDFFYNQRAKTIENFVNKKNPKILDYGCGSGKLVEQLKKSGIQINGFEPSTGALNLTKRKNLPVFNYTKRVKGGYDVIMFWHSLEHIDKPFETIKNIKRYLNKNGKLLIAVPNADSFEAKIFKDKWFHYSYPLHAVHFTPKSAKVMLEKNGFKISKIDFLNPEYTISGLVQSFLNVFLPKDVLYSVVSHRRLTMSMKKAILFFCLSVLLTIFSSPFILILFIIELIFKRTGAMVIFAKNG